MGPEWGSTANGVRASRGRRPARTRVFAALACLPLLLAACSGSDEPAATGTATSPTQGATASATDPTTDVTGGQSPSATTSGLPCDTTGFATTAAGDTALSRMTVSGVRVGQQTCFDRFVVDLSGDASTLPGHQVHYVPQVLEEGSGTPVTLRGSAFLRVTVGAPAYDQTGQPTYIPRNRAEVADVTGFTSLKQIAWAGSFEGMTSWGIGVREQLPYKVTVLTEDGRTRLVVDVAHAAS